MKILLFFLASISVFCLSAQNVRTNSELLWEISSPKNTIKSYLFGTLHSNDKRVFYLSDSVYYALDQAQAVLLETNIFDYLANYLFIITSNILSLKFIFLYLKI